MAQSSNEVTLNSYYSDNASFLDNDNMQIEYDSFCEISFKIINKNKILKTKRDLLEKEILELNEKIKKLKRSKEIQIACKSCDELKSENAKLKETQVKFVKFDKSANTLREMLDNQKSSSCKIGRVPGQDVASRTQHGEPSWNLVSEIRLDTPYGDKWIRRKGVNFLVVLDKIKSIKIITINHIKCVSLTDEQMCIRRIGCSGYARSGIDHYAFLVLSWR
ncbi:hypothetical protein Tco_0955170 [Tanacetum coccineum]|uniref:Uncharacterized protein n=1 Tax=Tanacetum coccineum TaxID=301880 RepID=A0ABQ5E6E5_9ASTR